MFFQGLESHKVRGTLLGVLIITIIVYFGVYIGVTLLGETTT